MTLEYLSKRGMELFQISQEEIKSSGENNVVQYLSNDFFRKNLPNLPELIHGNDDNQTFTFFQQILHIQYAEPLLLMGSVRVLMRDDKKTPTLLIASAIQVNPLQHFPRKIFRMLEEYDFIMEHGQTYSTLTAREKQILKLIAKGKTNKEIAEEAFITVNTAETHRKNLKSKLGLKTNRDLQHFARVFEH